MKEIGVGVLGFGTVGAGVVEILQRNGALLTERLGVQLVLRAVADLDITTDRGVTVDSSVLTTDAMGVIEDESVDVIVELVGGTGVALEFTRRALKLGKTVVTANKKMLAEYGAELFALASENRADLLFEASVGGGIPIIRALREGLVANRTLEIQGILNGTCNYILTRMENEGLEFDGVLDEAQRLGYAEAEPSLDVDGYDSLHKAGILASLAHGFWVNPKRIYLEGVRGISPLDIGFGERLGYTIKQLAVVKLIEELPRKNGNNRIPIQVSVCPMLVPDHHVLASVNGVFNAIFVREGRTPLDTPTHMVVPSSFAD